MSEYHIERSVQGGEEYYDVIRARDGMIVYSGHSRKAAEHWLALADELGVLECW